MRQVKTRKALRFIQTNWRLAILKALLHIQKAIRQSKKVSDLGDVSNLLAVHFAESRWISLLQELSKGPTSNKKIKKTSKNYNCNSQSSPVQSIISKKYKSSKVSPQVVKRSIDLTGENTFTRLMPKDLKKSHNENKSPYCVYGSNKITKNWHHKENSVAEIQNKKVFDGKDTLNFISQDKSKRRYRIDRVKLSENKPFGVDVYLKSSKISILIFYVVALSKIVVNWLL